jgi:hypothetical protein
MSKSTGGEEGGMKNRLRKLSLRRRLDGEARADKSDGSAAKKNKQAPAKKKRRSLLSSRRF